MYFWNPLEGQDSSEGQGHFTGEWLIPPSNNTVCINCPQNAALSRWRRRGLREGRTPSAPARSVKDGRGRRRKSRKKLSSPLKLESGQSKRERSKTTKGPSCQPLPVLIKQRVHTPTPTPSKMLCTQQELLHSRLQLSLQTTSSLRKCQQPTGAGRGGAPPLLRTQAEQPQDGPRSRKSIPWTLLHGAVILGSEPPTAATLGKTGIFRGDPANTYRHPYISSSKKTHKTTLAAVMCDAFTFSTLFFF